MNINIIIMKIIYLFLPILFLLNFIKSHSFFNYSKLINNNLSKNNIFVLKSNQNNKIISKIKSVKKLTRFNNVLPTMFLTFSGGWIMNPSIQNLLNSNQFLITNIISLLIMLLSMVLNDLFDIELDKINNPTRPLITGEITEKEAMGVSILFIFLINYLTRTYLSINLQVITNLMLIGISIYTPFFKKITFIKNLYCAFTVSFSIFYTGLASIQNINYENINYKILQITISYIFFGSLNNELLLDIKDIKGDKQNNIITVPVLLGEKKSLIIINSLLYYNIISNTLSLIKLHNNLLIGIIPIFIFIPMIKNINKIWKSNYSSESIDLFTKNTTIPMFLVLLYMCILSYIQK